MASHSTLQYFPETTLQLQGGCAHFWLLSAATGISFISRNGPLPGHFDNLSNHQ
jgi:hypothetical protein